MMLKLGKFTYTEPVVALAPMAGISDLPFRRICQRLGSHYTVAEMVSARPELLSTEESQTRLQFDDNPNFPKIVQLVGGDARLMAEAAQLMQAKGADVIDINMGCPAKKVGKQNASSALLADLKQVEKILQTTVNAVKIPVTLKTRIGFNDEQINLQTVGKIAEDSGIAAIAVHGRTRAQRFQGQAKFEEIGELKAKSHIPVLANGDLTNAEQIKNLIKKYGFDGVLIGRAAQGNPWIFSEIRRALNSKESIARSDPYQAMIEHITALHALYPAPHSGLCARKHLHWYLKNEPLYPNWKEKINGSKTLEEQIEILQNISVNRDLFFQEKIIF
ncbi:tRNA dihydrouridine synthase DusB [Suttonella ornithocola]|uniref:tRNA-dihydrouridine synthase n=1 Tax=Suttonella ornithocola TaxID=279832 RepID=A0A380MMP9_9GAMM|nr:tRNA dihydrouridine synthase DusB [Suttonella ornithocola]SUO93890.1 Probable tRNA-dihydrouridine synthase [Suttonella ornithocola]